MSWRAFSTMWRDSRTLDVVDPPEYSGQLSWIAIELTRLRKPAWLGVGPVSGWLLRPVLATSSTTGWYSASCFLTSACAASQAN